MPPSPLHHRHWPTKLTLNNHIIFSFSLSLPLPLPLPLPHSLLYISTLNTLLSQCSVHIFLLVTTYGRPITQIHPFLSMYHKTSDYPTFAPGTASSTTALTFQPVSCLIVHLDMMCVKLRMIITEPNVNEDEYLHVVSLLSLVAQQPMIWVQTDMSESLYQLGLLQPGKWVTLIDEDSTYGAAKAVGIKLIKVIIMKANEEQKHKSWSVCDWSARGSRVVCPFVCHITCGDSPISPMDSVVKIGSCPSLLKHSSRNLCHSLSKYARTGRQQIEKWK